MSFSGANCAFASHGGAITKYGDGMLLSLLRSYSNIKIKMKEITTLTLLINARCE